MTLLASELSYRVPAARLLDRVSVRVTPGTVHAVLGPNGAGKSTLLRLLAGELAPELGTIELNGRPLAAWSPAQRARQRAVLPQAHALTFAFTAAEVVALGRLSAPRQKPEAEARLVHAALELAGVPHLHGRRYPTLSGGERARVQFARVMAQVWDPSEGVPGARFVLLDEPTASLDLAHQHDCLRAVRALAARGLGALVVLHDPNLALRYADAVTLLREGRALASGTPRDTLTADLLSRLYRIGVAVHAVPGSDVPVIAAAPPP